MPGYRNLAEGEKLDPTKEYWIVLSWWDSPYDNHHNLVEADPGLTAEQVKRVILDQDLTTGLTKKEYDAYLDDDAEHGFLEAKGPFRVTGVPARAAVPRGGRWPSQITNPELKRRLVR